MVVEFLENFYNIIGSVWFYVLIGFFVSFLINVFVPKKHIVQGFGKNSISSLVKAGIVGVILSACSYGALPIIASLRKKGATTSNCLTMIVASPWLGLSQIILLEYYVGFSSALIMFIVSFIVAIVCGLIFSIMEDEKLFESKKRITRALLIECNCEDGDDCAVNHDAVGETFNLLTNMLKGLFIALLLASLVKTFFTSAEVSLVFGSNVGSVLLAVPVAALMEVISEGLGVFAGQLYLLGASIGAVFTMMMVGVTADLMELKMVDTVFGRRTAFYYVLVSNLVIIVGAVVLNILL